MTDTADNGPAGVETGRPSAETTQAREGNRVREESTQGLRIAADLLSEISQQTGFVTLSSAVEAADAADSGQAFAAIAADLEDLAARSVKAAQTFATGLSGLQGDSFEDLAEITGRISQSFEAASRLVGEEPAAAAETLASLARKDASRT